MKDNQSKTGKSKKSKVTATTKRTGEKRTGKKKGTGEKDKAKSKKQGTSETEQSRNELTDITPLPSQSAFPDLNVRVIRSHSPELGMSPSPKRSHQELELCAPGSSRYMSESDDDANDDVASK